MEHDVTLTTNAVDALMRIRNGETFDVILCDLMMPEMTGVDFYVELQKLAQDQAMRVVFLTGGAFTPQARGFSSGCRTCDSKSRSTCRTSKR